MEPKCGDASNQTALKTNHSKISYERSTLKKWNRGKFEGMFTPIYHHCGNAGLIKYKEMDLEENQKGRKRLCKIKWMR